MSKSAGVVDKADSSGLMRRAMSTDAVFRQDSAKGLRLIHFATLLAGFTGVFGKWFTVDSFVITAGRSVVGCAALWFVAKYLGADLRVKSRRDLALMALSGALLAGHWFTFFYAIRVSSVAVGLLAFASYPLFVALAEPLVFKEKLHAYDFAGAAGVAAGLAIIGSGSLHGDSAVLAGLFWGVVSGALCAGCSLASRMAVRHYHPAAFACWQQLFVALTALPFAVRGFSVTTGKDAVLLVVMGVAFTAGLQMLFIGALKHIRAVTASIVLMLEPVYGILVAMVAIGEIPALRTVAGGAVVCGSALAVTVAHARRKNSA